MALKETCGRNSYWHIEDYVTGLCMKSGSHKADWSRQPSGPARPYLCWGKASEGTEAGAQATPQDPKPNQYEQDNQSINQSMEQLFDMNCCCGGQDGIYFSFHSRLAGFYVNAIRSVASLGERSLYFLARFLNGEYTCSARESEFEKSAEDGAGIGCSPGIMDVEFGAFYLESDSGEEILLGFVDAGDVSMCGDHQGGEVYGDWLEGTVLLLVNRPIVISLQFILLLSFFPSVPMLFYRLICRKWKDFLMGPWYDVLTFEFLSAFGLVIFACPSSVRLIDRFELLSPSIDCLID